MALSSNPCFCPGIHKSCHHFWTSPLMLFFIKKFQLLTLVQVNIFPYFSVFLFRNKYKYITRYIYFLMGKYHYYIFPLFFQFFIASRYHSSVYHLKKIHKVGMIWNEVLWKNRKLREKLLLVIGSGFVHKFCRNILVFCKVNLKGFS